MQHLVSKMKHEIYMQNSCVKYITTKVKYATHEVKHERSEVKYEYNVNMRQITWSMQ